MIQQTGNTNCKFYFEKKMIGNRFTNDEIEVAAKYSCIRFLFRKAQSLQILFQMIEKRMCTDWSVGGHIHAAVVLCKFLIDIPCTPSNSKHSTNQFMAIF